ncbi:MAG: hypothetical protein ACERKO_02665, partial [Acetanaerobacterium sp.]
MRKHENLKKHIAKTEYPIRTAQRKENKTQKNDTDQPARTAVFTCAHKPCKSADTVFITISRVRKCRLKEQLFSSPLLPMEAPIFFHIGFMSFLRG